jgi:hypothetical protein
MTRLRLGGAVLVCAVMGGPHRAQVSAVKSWKCEFPLVSTARWEGGQPKIKTSSQAFTFNIDAVNTEAHSARLIANAGSADCA